MYSHKTLSTKGRGIIHEAVDDFADVLVTSFQSEQNYVVELILYIGPMNETLPYPMAILWDSDAQYNYWAAWMQEMRILNPDIIVGQYNLSPTSLHSLAKWIETPIITSGINTKG